MPNLTYEISETPLNKIKMNLLYISQSIYGDDWHSSMHTHLPVANTSSMTIAYGTVYFKPKKEQRNYMRMI